MLRGSLKSNSYLLIVVLLLFPLHAFSQTTAGEKKTTTTTPPPAKKYTPPKKPKKKSNNGDSAANDDAKNKAEEEERDFWESISESETPADFQSYLKKYPKGKFVTDARDKLGKIEEARKTELTRKAEEERKKEEARKEDERKKTEVRKLFRNRYGMELVLIQAGSFMMGTNDTEALAIIADGKRYGWDINVNDEKSKRRVGIGYSFYMGKFEVTQAQWQAVMGNNPGYFKDCEKCPVEQVSWSDAQEFIKKLNALNDGYVYRLPSEAEWEYACRAGTTTVFAFGDTLSALQANFNGLYPFGNAARGQFISKTMPVGSYQPNPWGLHDMHGNVWEWCEDIYFENYDSFVVDGSANLSKGLASFRVLRGGSWYNVSNLLRSSARSRSSVGNKSNLIGFRVVATVRGQ